MNRILRSLRAPPSLLIAYAVLRADAVAAFNDPAVSNALDRFKADPAIAPLVPRISSEWRAVEDALEQMR